jgi:hypothetical protein
MGRWAWLGLALMGLSGCLIETPAPHPHDLSSTLTVTWSINDSVDPAQCRQSDADSFDIIVETRAGDFVDEFTANCEDFETSIDLPAGRYRASAILLDSRGRDRTTAVDIEPFTLFEGDEFVVDIDFPARSFL